MGPKIKAIFLIVVGLGIALYFYNIGGVTKLGSVLQGPASSSTASTSASSAPAVSSSTSSFFSAFLSLFQPPALPNYGGPSTGTAPTPQGNTGTQISAPNPSSPSIPAYEIPKGMTLADLSPYFHEVTFSGASTYQISLTGYMQGTTTIDITGWSIKTNRGGEYIPQAINFYDPSGLTPASDIRLRTGDYIYIYPNSGSINVRVNKCSGYLNEANQFNPPLPANCPYPNRAEISSFTGQCQNYINSLGGCQQPDLANPTIPQNDYSCRDYLQNHFSYKSCVDEHGRDQDFLSNEWLVWAGSTPLDPYHDNVKLLDKNGLVVDTYSY